MKCPKCGNENLNNTNICQFCGCEMLITAAMPPQTDAVAPVAVVKPKAKKKTAIIIIAIVVALAVLAGSLFIVLTKIEEKKQLEAITGVTIYAVSDGIEEMSIIETDDGMIGTHEDTDEHYQVIADEYGNARQITLTVDVDMTTNSSAYNQLMTMTSQKYINEYIGGLNGAELKIDLFVWDAAVVYELCLDKYTGTGINEGSIDEVVSMINEEKEVNGWSMIITYDDDSVTFKAEYVG
jgi:hypothetical protein